MNLMIPVIPPPWPYQSPACKRLIPYDGMASGRVVGEERAEVTVMENGKGPLSIR